MEKLQQQKQIPPPLEDSGKMRTTVLFSISDHIGALDEVLQIVKNHKVNLARIESRPSKTADFDYDFFIDLQTENEKTSLELVEALKPAVKNVKVVGQALAASSHSTIPWFPRKKSDLDSFADKTLEYGADLDSDHPGFKDVEYRKRRAEITKIARTHKHGSPIPEIQYFPGEIETWGIVFNKLTALYPTHACRQHQYVFPLLIENCGYRPNNIPQLETISKFLKECTGFTLRPVMGLLSSRDFLNGLAFRVFHSTQYIRHHSHPFYTPEPDLCHELLGHVPLFADPDFAEFSQEIGLASLGASDEDVQRLATIYWFTVEFGVCKEGNSIKAYGAGLLSSAAELEYCVSDKPTVYPFDPEKAASTKYPITEFQPIYFVADSFKDATEKVRVFAANLHRPFSVRYNPYTETIEVLDTKEKMVRYATTIQGEMKNLIDAISKLSQ